LASTTALVVPAAKRRASNAICLVGISMCYLTTTEGPRIGAAGTGDSPARCVQGAPGPPARDQQSRSRPR
jgi:hypothetical protein